jgi:hypothetical protein
MPSKDIHKLTGRAPSSRKKKWQLETRICNQCKEGYRPIRQRQKYCSAKCREDFWSDNRRWLPDPETVEEEQIKEYLAVYFRSVKCLPDHGEITIEF